MGERVQRVALRAFRGVPGEMSLEFPNGRSSVIFGDNGSGKSSFADALEWYFTGSIELLRHEGREHAVRHLGAPEDVTTCVTVETLGSLGGTQSLTDEGPSNAALEVSGRETFLLRGRTLAAFVDKTKGEKWKALAELLGLEAVDELRLDLQRMRNDLRKEAQSAAQAQDEAGRALAGQVNELSHAAIFESIRALCEEAGVPPPETLENALEPEWAASITGRDVETSRAVETKSLIHEMKVWEPPSLEVESVRQWNEVMTTVTTGDRVRMRFLQAADAFLSEVPAGGRCPLCSQAIEDERLVERVKATLETVHQAAEDFENASTTLSRLISVLREVDSRANKVQKRALRLGLEVSDPPMTPAPRFEHALDSQEHIEEDAIAEYQRLLMEWESMSKARLEAGGEEASGTGDGALVQLGVLVAATRSWVKARDTAHQAAAAARYAEQIFEIYQRKQHDHFKEVLDRISGRVASIYSTLHPGESLEDVCVEPWKQNGVELAVTFHGHRQKPPHSVLSESHLNSLAIAVFLAMAETFNERLGFLVLDDVVNSLDDDHRGELASLLAREYRDWQLIVLTHDHLFYERLSRVARDWKRIEFTSWAFGDGPRTAEYETGTLLEKAWRLLRDGDSMGAATKGRRAMEEVLQEICEGLQAPLPFRRGVKNDRREIGELLKGMRRELRAQAKDLYVQTGGLLNQLEADVAAALNVEAHAGGRASAAEIRVALEHIEELDRIWRCDECGTRVWSKGTPESFRCNCGRVHFPPLPAVSGNPR